MPVRRTWQRTVYMALPQFLQIEPVGQCNLRCQMCPVQFRSDGPSHGVAFMAPDDFNRLIDQFTTVKELHLQGLGEPMMHPRLCPINRASRAVCLAKTR